jgi:hypothetical protein
MNRFLALAVGLGCTVALVVACFGSALLKGEQFGYRDAAHFYYPLYLRVQQEWEAGRIPLWEPEENGGMPLLGNPTAAVLYPGKILYGLFSYDWAARLYIVAHTLLALGLMYALLRAWSVSQTGASLGGLSYAFGAPVLFQYCNVTFLVGAAWVPLGILGADLWVRLGRRSGLVWLAISLAMQAVGGELQSAYVTGLCGAGYALGSSWAARRPRWQPSTGSIFGLAVLAIGLWIAVSLALAWWLPGAIRPRPGVSTRLLKPTPEWIPPQLFPGRGGWTWLSSVRLWRTLVRVAWVVVGLIWMVRWARRRRTAPGDRALAGLLGAAVLAFALIGPQILPVLEYGGLTVRAVPDSPHEIFPFSLEPYRILELVWPNIFGSSFGANRSWLLFIPPAHPPKFWVPSLYIGGAALVLAVGAATVRRGDPRRVWMTWVVLVSLSASFGEFTSPIYHARNFRVGQALLGPHDSKAQSESRLDGNLRDGDGSFYWLLAWGLPEFYTFRYPSKLLTFTCLGLAALAGFGWDHVLGLRMAKPTGREDELASDTDTTSRPFLDNRPARLALVLAVISLACLAFTFVAGDGIKSAWTSSPLAKGLSPWGPFDAKGALLDLRVALLHGTIVFLLTLTVIGLAARRSGWASAAILVLLTGDLLLPNPRLVKTVPTELFHGTPEILRIIQEAEKAKPFGGPYRVHRMPLWTPNSWNRATSGDRVHDFTVWERKTIQPKYALPFGCEYTLTEGTAELYDYWFFFAPFRGNHDDDVGQRVGLGPGEKVVYYPRRGFDMWNSRYFVLPSRAANDEHRSLATFLSECDPIAPNPEDFRGPGSRERLERWVMYEDWQILRNNKAYPRAWVVHDARFIPPITDMNKESRAGWMEEMLYQADPFWNNPERRVWDPRELAWIEADDEARLAITPLLTRGPTEPSELPRFTHYDPQRVEIEVNLTRPGIVVLADVFYPGWYLTVDGQPTPILRANRMMRGVALPSGTHRLVFRFDPPSFRLGLVLAVVGFLALVFLVVSAARQPRPAGA